MLLSRRGGGQIIGFKEIIRNFITGHMVYSQIENVMIFTNGKCDVISRSGPYVFMDKSPLNFDALMMMEC